MKLSKTKKETTEADVDAMNKICDDLFEKITALLNGGIITPSMIDYDWCADSLTTVCYKLVMGDEIEKDYNIGIEINISEL